MVAACVRQCSAMTPENGSGSVTGWSTDSREFFITHIGVDRAIGYGLKYPTGFKDTHLQRV
jgi:Domain of unknown function (DUF4260)